MIKERGVGESDKMQKDEEKEGEEVEERRRTKMRRREEIERSRFSRGEKFL